MDFSIYTYEPNSEGETVKFSHDKYNFKAESWEQAEIIAKNMNLPYRYEIIGDCPEDEEYVSDDFILDVIIAGRKGSLNF